MKKKIAMQWADALESGDYIQGEGQLRFIKRDIKGNPISTEFCCLGVLCNLHAQAFPKLAAKQEDPEEYLGESGFAPTRVMKWSGLKNADGNFFNLTDEVVDWKNGSLAELNDEYPDADFNFIAAFIRRNYKEL